MLRSPDFGNSFKFVPNTVFHRTMNGDLRTHQGTRPKWEGFQVSFSALSRTDMDAFKNYIISSRGQIISLTDFENRNWTGVITSPQLEIIKSRDGCNYSTSFEFEGQVEV